MENQVKIATGTSSFSIFPGMGATLNELILGGKTIFRAAHSDTQIQQLTREAFNGTQLFPFPNRLKGGKYTYHGTSYELPPNEKGPGHALHGLVYDQCFQIIDTDPEGFIKTALLLEGHPGYPFAVHVINEMTLSPDALSIKTEVKNVGKSQAPVGHGWHPYFSGSGNIDACKLKLPSKHCLEVDSTLIPTGQFLPFDDFNDSRLLSGTQLDTCLEINPYLGSIQFENPMEGFIIGIETNGYDYLQVYTPPGRDCIAIEPQSCAPDAFNNRLGLIELKPEESRSFHMRIALK